MISEAIINLSVVGATCLILVIYLVKFVLSYKHEYESNPLCTSTVLVCLLVVLLATFVLPVDIFLVSFVKDSSGTFKSWATNETLEKITKSVTYTYHTLYGASAFLIFIVIPFLHFLNEESETNPRDRVHHAIKYTFGFLILMLVLLTAGALIPITDNLEPNTVFERIIHLEKGTKAGNALVMVLTTLTMAGFINVTFYTASGIFSWPIGLIMGTRSVSDSFQSILGQEELLRLRISNLREKARAGRLSPREQEQLDQAESQLRDIEREELVLTAYGSTWTYKLRKAIRPLQITLGVFFSLLSILLLGTLVAVNIDRVLHSAGPKQGYVLLDSKIFNPMEYIFVKFQDLVLVGPMPLLVVTCFLTVATISGMRNLGLWFLCARLHRIKVGRTEPQALLFFCITMMLAALAFNLTLYSMMSQYVTFGDQNYQSKVGGNWTVKPCDLSDYHEDCIPTRGSILLMKMMSQVWVFGAIFYWWSWAFVVVATISFVAYLKRGRRDATHGIVNIADDFEE